MTKITRESLGGLKQKTREAVMRRFVKPKPQPKPKEQQKKYKGKERYFA